MAHGHGHSHKQEQTRPKKMNNILLAFSLNASFAIIEFFGGILTNSVAIMSDALHDFGDSLALLFAYFAERLSHRKPDAKYTFGYKRFSVVAALVNGTILILGSLFVIKEAVERLVAPEAVMPEGMIYLAILGISVNSFAAYRLSKDEGLNVKMLMYHLIEDLLGWIAVLVVSVVLLFKPWYVLDSILSILISVLILSGVYRSLKKVVKIFVQQFPEGIEQANLINKIKVLKDVVDVHLLQGWSLDESTWNVTLHVVVPGEIRMFEADSLRKQIERILKEHKIALSTIQIESEGDNLKE